MRKPIVLTAHARIRLQDRRIDPKWIEEAVLDPDWLSWIPEIQLLNADFASCLNSADAFFAWHVSRQIRAFAL